METGERIEAVVIGWRARVDRNWKVADIAPQPSLLVSEKVRVTLARLTGIYALEDEGE